MFHGLAALFCANPLKLTNRAKTSSPDDLALRLGTEPLEKTPPTSLSPRLRKSQLGFQNRAFNRPDTKLRKSTDCDNTVTMLLA